MTLTGPAFQECTWFCPESLTVLAQIEIVAILVHYPPSYNTSNTMKPSDPLLLADVTLRFGMDVLCMQS